MGLVRGTYSMPLWIMMRLFGGTNVSVSEHFPLNIQEALQKFVKMENIRVYLYLFHLNNVCLLHNIHMSGISSAIFKPPLATIDMFWSWEATAGRMRTSSNLNVKAMYAL